MIDILLILGFILVILGGILSLKFKHENRKKWWVPLAITGGILAIIIVLTVIVSMVLLTTTLCV